MTGPSAAGIAIALGFVALRLRSGPAALRPPGASLQKSTSAVGFWGQAAVVVGRLGLPERWARDPRVVVGGAAGAVAGAGVVGGPAGAGLTVAALGFGAWRLRATAPARRAARADGELPAVLEGVARRLRAGGSLAQALAEAAPPAGAELDDAWGALIRAIPHLGVAGACDRWGADDATRPPARLAAAALALAAETGGAPARAVDGVAATLRARAGLADELRALTASARASAAMIAAAPVAFGALTSITDPRTRAFLHTTAGLVTTAAGLALDGLGWWWMGRLCRAVT